MRVLKLALMRPAGGGHRSRASAAEHLGPVAAVAAQADALAHKLLDSISAPFQLGPHTCHVSMTIGYALAPLSSCYPWDIRYVWRKKSPRSII